VLEWLLQLGEDLATLSIFAVLAVWVYSKWKRTLGRRWELARNVTALGPEMQLDYVEQRLGAPTFRTKNGGYEELVWVEPYAFIRVMANKGTVKLYAVTTRTRWFAPTFYRRHIISVNGDSLEVRLGRTTLGDLPGSPSTVWGDVGARRWGYSEAYYFGNPGLYLAYVYSLSDAGWSTPSSTPLQELLVSRHGIDLGSWPAGSVEWDDIDDELMAARNAAAFNTLTVLSLDFDMELRALGVTPAADLDLVRLDPRTRL
jgi:hypothetical protein